MFNVSDNDNLPLIKPHLVAAPQVGVVEIQKPMQPFLLNIKAINDTFNSILIDEETSIPYETLSIALAVTARTRQYPASALEEELLSLKEWLIFADTIQGHNS